VELLFYFFDGETRELLERERDGLRARQGRFTYSVHLPDHLREEHRVLLELVRGLAGTCVLHPPPAGEEEFLELVRRWRREFGDVFLLENLVGRSFERLAAELQDIPLCLDTGHLLLNGARLGPFLGTYGPRIREIHLHGVREGADHRPPAPGEAWLAELAPFLRRFEGTVNLEIFSRADLDSSLRALRDAGLLD